MKLYTTLFLTSLTCAPLALTAGETREIVAVSQATVEILPASTTSTTPVQAESSVPSSPSTGAAETSAPMATAPAPSGTIQWFDDYRAGMQQAQKEHKPVFLYFTGSDWCGWCKKLDQEVLSQPDFARAVGSKFVFVKLDFPMNRSGSDASVQQNLQLKQQYGVTGFPTVVLIDAKGNFLAETGYRSGGARSYASYIEQLMNSSQS